jgi:hypothetical protein
MATDETERAQIERVLARPVADATQAVWGFTNRTDIVTSAPGSGWWCSATAAARMPNTGCG